MTSRFEENQIDSPRLISEMLLTHVLGGQRIDLYANANRPATDDEREILRSYVKRTLEHEPVQYIVGKAWFNGMEFTVNSSTLIPRTCTETIVDQCLLVCDTNSFPAPPRIADIGTGSGCIAISIAANTTSCTIVATDVSNDALELATENAIMHKVSDKISFVQGDGMSPLLRLEPFDIICSNPPYIPENEMAHLDLNVKNWEPVLSLAGGKNGLELIEPILEFAPQCLNSEGILLIELAMSTKDTVLELANANAGLRDAVILRDRFGDDRFLRAIKHNP
jgi:release factor glutamine methyltransferase